MRARRFLLGVTAVVLVLGWAAVGCSNEETGSSDTTSTTVAAESASTTGRPDTYKTVDVLTAFDALKSNEAAQMVDVREPEEWTVTGVPPGAVLIPLADVESRAPAELAPDRPVYVICRTGNRSRTASETLIGLGYAHVFNVEGGIEAWTTAGLPIVPYEP
jgi:rhodanese-related sulfurtransferase